MKLISNMGHTLASAVESILYVRDAKFARARVFAAGALFGAVFLVSTAHLAMADTFNTYAKDVGGKTNSATDIVSYISYIGGAILGALGIVDLKKHVEQPSQVPLKNGLAKVGFGGMLLALPTVLSVATDTTKTDGTVTYTGFKGGSEPKIGQ